MKCYRCGVEDCVKNGKVKGKQRYRCNGCGNNFSKLTPPGRPLREKALALILYMNNVSMNASARIIGVSVQTILRWVRQWGETCPDPVVPEMVELEIDEMWHYIQKKLGSSG